MNTTGRRLWTAALLVSTGFAVPLFHLATGAQAQSAPRYVFDPTWPKPLPNKWKIVANLR